MNTYTRIGLEIGELVDQKNAAYGSSFAKCGEFLRLLWPEGLTPERYGDALLLARIFDKIMRIATDRDAFGESPYRDIAGYGLLGAELRESMTRYLREQLQEAFDEDRGPLQCMPEEEQP